MCSRFSKQGVPPSSSAVVTPSGADALRSFSSQVRQEMAIIEGKIVGDFITDGTTIPVFLLVLWHNFGSSLRLFVFVSSFLWSPLSPFLRVSVHAGIRSRSQWFWCSCAVRDDGSDM